MPRHRPSQLYALVLGSALLAGSPAMSADCPAFLGHEFTKLH